MIPNLNLDCNQNTRKSATERNSHKCKVLYFMLKNTLKYIVKLYCAFNFRSSHLSKNLHGVYMNASF